MTSPYDSILGPRSGDSSLMATGLDQLDAMQLQALLRDGWRLTPATMATKITDGRWHPAPHLLYVSTIIANAVHQGNQFVIVSMPPRHGKSELLSVHTPIWFLDTWPKKRIILASYGAELATEFSDRVRNTFLDEDLYSLLRTRLRPDRQRIDNFKTVDGGGMISIGIGGSATGKGADLLLIDDYVKNAEEALSDSQKKKAWDWFLSTAYTRLEPGATVIVLATRWDKKDLIGYILEKADELAEKGFDRPTLVNIPALARHNDVLGRKPGEPLWPERYDLKKLLQIQAVMGTYWWNALYQQDPPASMSGLNLGDKIKEISPDEIPARHKLKSARIWDMAATPDNGEQTDADFTAAPLCHYDKETDRFYIEEAIHARLSPKQVQDTMRQTAEMDGPGLPIWMEQEPGSAGVWVVEHIQTELLPEFDVSGEKSTGPFEVRSQPFTAAVEAGKVYACPGAYLPKLREELNGYPEPEHNDLIVACSLGFRKLANTRFGGAVWGRSRNAASRSDTVTSIQAYRNSKYARKKGRLTW